jgi:PQQ-like domain
MIASLENVPTGGGTFGGTVTTSGNLVFQATPDGRLFAYSADKGEKLLEIQTGLRGGMSPPITWMLEGKQYVTVLGGNGIVISRNTEPGAPPPPPSANTVFPKMLTFVLDGVLASILCSSGRRPCKSVVKRKQNSLDARNGGARKIEHAQNHGSQCVPLGDGSCRSQNQTSICCLRPVGAFSED